MGCLENEARTAMTVLLKQGHSQSSVARLLGVSEGAVRYHRRRDAAGAVDGRAAQVSKAATVAEAIAHWRSQQSGGRVNLAALHEWLKPSRDTHAEPHLQSFRNTRCAFRGYPVGDSDLIRSC